jgi:hypothetical protein
MASSILRMFWPAAPTDLSLNCPAAPPGANPDPTGIFDPSALGAAYLYANIASLVAVLVAVGACYLMTRTTLGPRFVARWWLFSAVASLLCALSATIVRYYPTVAFAGSCENNPEAFPMQVGWDVVLARAAVGLGWGLVAYFVASLVLSQTAGRARWGGGFFHNRGYPWPRLLRPLAE